MDKYAPFILVVVGSGVGWSSTLGQARGHGRSREVWGGHVMLGKGQTMSVQVKEDVKLMTGTSRVFFFHNF